MTLLVHLTCTRCLWIYRIGLVTIKGDTLICGTCVLVPYKLHGLMMHEVHCNHPWITSMKKFARSSVCLSKLNKPIEELVNSCISYQESKDAPTVAQLHPWFGHQNHSKGFMSFCWPFLLHFVLSVSRCSLEMARIAQDDLNNFTQHNFGFPTAFLCLWYSL